MNKFLLIILIILFISIIYNCYSYENKENFFNNNEKPYLWLFWEGYEPEYIKLCYETVIKQCSDSFNIVKLNDTNIHDYLPDIKNYDLSKLIIQHKVDIYRIMLLYKYGGIYLDADIVVLKDLTPIIDKLKKHDFVGFGCTGIPCTKYYGYPSNWILASRKGTKLMKNVLDHQLTKLKEDKLEYHDIGKMVIWNELEKLMKNDKYEYYHFNPKYDGSRDKHGSWITTDIVFSNEKIEYEDEDNMLVYVFYNSNIDNNLKKLTREELLAKDWNYTRFIKKSLNITN